MFTTIVERQAWTCARCSIRTLRLLRHNPIRKVSARKLSSSTNIVPESQVNISRIHNDSQKSILTTLTERGLIYQTAGDRADLDNLLTTHRAGAYCGVDPTAPSLHVGHLLPLMSLFWLYLAGHPTILLLGGATSSIGDPSGRLTTRTTQATSTRLSNIQRMHAQMSTLWQCVERYASKYGFQKTSLHSRQLLNNDSWISNLSLLEFLQVLGSGTRMGTMLSKETVRNKMREGDGMSYAEFTYPLLQAWDWWHMYRTFNTHIQIGGADQWGNITVGIDAIKYIRENHPSENVRAELKAKEREGETGPMGFTVPLLTTSSGQKFGKSAGNAIWLDKSMTSTFELYGYFMKTTDVDVARYLRLFTFMPLEEIETLMLEHERVPKERQAQRKLAFEFLELVHGREEAEGARRAHESLFGGTNATTKEASASGDSTANLKPDMVISREELRTTSLAATIKMVGHAKSNSEAHRLLSSGSMYIGSMSEEGPGGALTYTSVTTSLSGSELIDRIGSTNGLLLLRRGKSNLKVIHVEDSS